MDLIMKCYGGFRYFQSEWREKWSIAILKYFKQLKRRDIKTVLTCSHDEGIYLR